MTSQKSKHFVYICNDLDSTDEFNLSMSVTGATLWYVRLNFGAKILPAYSPLDIKVKQQLQSGENATCM